MGIGLVKDVCLMLTFAITRHLTAQPFQDCSRHRLRVIGIRMTLRLPSCLAGLLVRDLSPSCSPRAAVRSVGTPILGVSVVRRFTVYRVANFPVVACFVLSRSWVVDRSCLAWEDFPQASLFPEQCLAS